MKSPGAFVARYFYSTRSLDYKDSSHEWQFADFASVQKFSIISQIIWLITKVNKDMFQFCFNT